MHISTMLFNTIYISFKLLDHAVSTSTCAPGINIVCLASMDLIFIIIVYIVLCCVFVPGMVLIAHSVLATAEQRLHGVKAFFPTPGGGQEAGRVHGQHIWQTLTKGTFSTFP